ncbi:hypothetical protein TL16_g05086 [Triparma laevis f. inornata]|uniref:Uncharacterized protein n=1 Tax=Triparma laevis f. inornata TaxID=1714386 RepID=A0A9W7E8B4_9STRA|nr:hypothetical protein TL16_g05086 [Triparma laevis f. inornata]
MNFPSEHQNDRSAIRARQKAYLASLDAQVSQLNRKKALDDVQDGHFVRNLPATPDEMLNGVLLAPLPPVDGKRGSPRGIGKGLKQLQQANNPNVRNGRLRYGKSYESGVSQIIGGLTDYEDGPEVEIRGGEKNFNKELAEYLMGPPQKNSNQRDGGNINLNYANGNNMMVNAVSEQLNKFSVNQHRTESTITWLTEQLQRNRTDSSKHTKMLVDQHTKDAESLAALRDRLRNEGVENSASAAIAELKAREEDSKLRQQSEENRSRRMAEALTELTSRMEDVRQMQAKLEDDVQSRLGTVENSVVQQTDRLVNMVDRESDHVVSQQSMAEGNNSNIVDLQNSLKQVITRLANEEDSRRQLERSLIEVQNENRRLIKKETDTLHSQILAEASARREGTSEVDEKNRFLGQIIEEREKANIGMVEERILRLERAAEGSDAVRKKQNEAREKEARKFFNDIAATARTETDTMKARHEAMTAQTVEQLRELSHEVVQIQETTRKAEKRIGELTAGSLQGISTAMESGMKQFQQDVKEIREVLSAEITARRNGNEKVIKRVEDVELKEESALSELTELLGTQVRRLQDEIEAIPAMIEQAKVDAKVFTTDECEKVKSELYLEIKEIVKRMDDLSQHVEDVRAESKRAREHLEVNLQRMNTHLVDVDTMNKKVELKLSEEVMERESHVQKVNAELTNAFTEERMEREKEDQTLSEKISEVNLILIEKIEREDNDSYNKSKQEMFELGVACQEARTKLMEQVVQEAENMDQTITATLRKEIADSVIVGKSYAEQVSQEKTSHLHETIEIVREGLTKQCNSVKESLELEVDVRTGDIAKVKETVGEEVRRLGVSIDALKLALDREKEMEEEERNKILQEIVDACNRVEAIMGQKLISEGRSIRSLIKASVAAEASERMSEVNDAKQLAEHRLLHEKDALVTADARDKEFVLMKAAEWVDNEKSDRMKVDQSLQNEMDVRSAAVAAKEESREVLRMIGDQIQDTDMLNRHREVVWDIRKLRKFAIEVKTDLGVLKKESENEDLVLGGRLDKEVEDRISGDAKLEKELEEKMAKEVEDRIGGDTALREGLDEEVTKRTEEVLRLDGRVDNLWEEKEVLEKDLGKTIEATAKGLNREVARRLQEDAEVREEELCREGTENAMRYIVDKIVGKMEQDEQLEVLGKIETRFDVVNDRLKRNVAHAISVAEDNLRAAKETIRIDNDAEHRDMVQLVRDETGAIRGDVANMLGEIETAVKGAEGSVITLDEKTSETFKKQEELIKGAEEKVEEVKKSVQEEVKKEIEEKIKGAEEKVESVKKEMEGSLEKMGEEWGKERKAREEVVKEESEKAAKNLIEAEIKTITDKIDHLEREKTGIDWDALRNKGGVTGGGEKGGPEEEKP